MLSFKVVIVFIACLPWSYCSNSNNYCSLCRNHTMCIYPDVGPECKESGDSGISQSDKKEILDVHNWLRRVVASGKETRGASKGQPKAANLRKFVWDNDLAAVAQRWANQCHFGHDTCRKDPRWAVGQNVYWKSQHPKHPVNWTNAILSWYNEVAKFNPENITPYKFDPQTGHYTQMLWHDTYALGCGRKDYGQQKLYVCNYGPTGNMLGDRMYIVGEPCSSCPQGTVCEDSLCATPLKISPNIISETSQEQKTASASWHRKTNPDKTKSSKEKSSDSKNTKESHTPEGKSEDTKQHGKTTHTPGEDDNDIVLDEETKNEVDKIHAQIENLLKSFLKKCRNLRKEGIKARGALPTLSDCIHSNLYRQLLNSQ